MINFSNEFNTLDMDCDGANCAKHAYFDCGSFNAAIEEAKQEGWIIRAEDLQPGQMADFYHYCSAACAAT